MMSDPQTLRKDVLWFRIPQLLVKLINPGRLMAGCGGLAPPRAGTHMHQRVVGLFAGVEQEVEGPPVLSPLDGCRRAELADG